jgi:hypothetical protein
MFLSRRPLNFPEGKAEGKELAATFRDRRHFAATASLKDAPLWS